MAKMENDLKNDEFGKLIDECNDALALLGHSNKHINLSPTARSTDKKMQNLRPELATAKTTNTALHCPLGCESCIVLFTKIITGTSPFS